MNYQQQTLAVKNSVELIVELYDGMTRFLHKAAESIEVADVDGRRQNMKRVLDILTYLQGRLQADEGGEAANALTEFYATMYSQCVIASRDSSVEIIEETIRNIRNVRDAWQTVATSDASQGMLSRDRQTREEKSARHHAVQAPAALVDVEPVAHRWSA
jgi:flagellar protein FliS